MDGIVIHDRIKNPKQRIKAQAFILNNSKNQNFNQGVPQLIDGPPELNPETLPSEMLTDAVGTINSTVSSVPVPLIGLSDMEEVSTSDGSTETENTNV